MKSYTIEMLKTKFSEVLQSIKNDENIIIEYGKNHEKPALIIPYKKYLNKKRKVGILNGKASFQIDSSFKISDQEFISLK